MDIGIHLVIMAVFGIICSLIAHSRGRNAVGWFFVGVFAGCIGLIILLVLPDVKAEEERQERLRRENRRLREELRKDRQVADRRHHQTFRRLEVHDRALDIDTSRSLTDTSAPLSLEGAEDEPPPAPPIPGGKTWYYLVGELQKGPVTETTLHALWRQRRIGPDTFVWREGMQDWLPVGEVPGLEGKLGA